MDIPTKKVKVPTQSETGRSVHGQDLFPGNRGVYSESVDKPHYIGSFKDETLSGTPLSEVPPPPTISSQPENVLYWETHDLDLIVLPSLSVDPEELQKITGVNHYEERQLFNLIMLRRPKCRLFYITSVPLDPSILEYYLSLLPDVSFKDFRKRLVLLSTYDSSPRPLSEKLLERPRLMKRLKDQLRKGKAAISCFAATQLEHDVAQQLEVPLLASPPELSFWGSKSGSRAIFEECGVPLADGIKKVHSPEELTEEMTKFWERRPDVKRMVVKIDESFSGEGNAVFDFRKINNPMPATHEEKKKAIEGNFEGMSFAGTGENWPHYSGLVSRLGAIAEEFLEGDEKYSPSTQCCIDHQGRVEILSTHEQILGGADGQIYLGCRFPADEPYRVKIQNYGRLVGEALGKHGCLDHYGVDFLTRPTKRDAEGKPTEWDIHALEINLRSGGTTHPLMALKLLADGHYDEKTGLYIANDQGNNAKYYLASDNLIKPTYRGLMPNDLMEIIESAGLSFDHKKKTGIVFHLLGALSEYGKVGLTCIHNSRPDTKKLYDAAVRAIDEAVANPPTFPGSK